jgi:hypothetical protein
MRWTGFQPWWANILTWLGFEDFMKDYLGWMAWAKELTKKGVKQKQCPCCGLWLFPGEKCKDSKGESK